MTRQFPHSVEAEEYLLSCCLIDGPDVLARCLEAGICAESFYVPAHATLFERLLGLFKRQAPIDVAVLAEELRAAKQLDEVGGYAFLSRVSGAIPTTADAGHFVERVLDFWLRRKAIRSAMLATEQIGDLGLPLEGVLERFRRDTENLGTVHAHDMPWAKLLAFDKKNDPDCLMGNRFLGRTAACMMVAPSGVGKSVLALQLGVCAALQRPFFGMMMRQAMRVLYVQAEDDMGDVAEGAQGIIEGFDLTPDEVAKLSERLRVVRWNDAAGDKFLSRLRTEHRKRPYDLVIVNPLFSFAGCNVSDQKEISPFLRNGLNPVLNETKAAAAIVHHTNKPSTDPNNQPSDVNAELSYLGSGSAELTNWPRAYVTLQLIKAAGGRVYKMTFAKRGHRAGIIDSKGHPTTGVFIEHSTDGLYWKPSDYAPEQGHGGKFLAKFDLQRALRVYDSKLDWPTNLRRIAEDQDMSERAVRAYKQALEAAA